MVGKETPTPLPPNPYIPRVNPENVRERERLGVLLCDKIVSHLRLPISGKGLYEVFEEIRERYRAFESQIQQSGPSGIAQIDEIKQLMTQIQGGAKEWERLFKQIYESSHPESFDVGSLELHLVVPHMLYTGVKLEQKYRELNGYELRRDSSKLAAFLGLFSAQVSQEYMEEFFKQGRWPVIQGFYDSAQEGFRLTRAKAQILIKSATPELQRHLTGLTPKQFQILCGRMEHFFATNNFGKQILSLSLKGAGKTLHGMQEGLFSPMCACMLVTLLDGAEDKEKVFIQYVTFLLVGQVLQRGVEGTIGLIEFLMQSAPKGSKIRDSLAQMKNLLRSSIGKKYSPHALLVVSVAVVLAFFTNDDFLQEVIKAADTIEKNWDHGVAREATIGITTLLAYGMQFASRYGTWLAVFVEAAKIGFDEYNPFLEQENFLFGFVTGDTDNLVQMAENIFGRDPITAWNIRVEDLKKYGNTTLNTILDGYKIKDAQDWILKNMVQFRLLFQRYEQNNALISDILPKLTSSPDDSKQLFSPEMVQSLRYTDYTFAESDVWHERDRLGDPRFQYNPREGVYPADSSTSVAESAGSFNDGYGPSPPVGLVVGMIGWGNIAGRNDKALDYLNDSEGSNEKKINDFFQNQCPKLIEQQKNRLETIRIPEERKRISDWISAMEQAKIVWDSQQLLGKTLARKVVIARGLKKGLYKKADWTGPLDTNNPFSGPREGEQPSMAYLGMMDFVARRGEVLSLLDLDSGEKATNLIRLLGYSKRRYGAHQLIGVFADFQHNFKAPEREKSFSKLLQVVDSAYKSDIPVEYLKDACQPLVDMAIKLETHDPNTSKDVMWISSELAQKISEKICTNVLDYYLIKEYAETDKLPHSISWKGAGVTFFRTIQPSSDGMCIDVKDSFEGRAFLENQGYRFSYLHSTIVKDMDKNTYERIFFNRMRMYKRSKITNNTTSTLRLINNSSSAVAIPPLL